MKYIDFNYFYLFLTYLTCFGETHLNSFLISTEQVRLNMDTVQHRLYFNNNQKIYKTL